MTETLLRSLMHARHLSPFRAFDAAFRKAARELALQEEDPALAKVTISARSLDRWCSGQVATMPRPDACRVLEHMFGHPVSVLLGTSALPAANTALPDLALSDSTETEIDEIAAIELARKAAASDVSDGTCEQIEAAVDELAIAYPSFTSADLLPRVRTHLSYTTRLLDGRSTLEQRRRLLVSGGWLSLLTATLLIDLNRDTTAQAYLRTATQLAGETGHAELAAWCAETRAWQALTSGAHREAVELSRMAQRVAPRGTSVFIQASAQEGRAWARLGDSREARTSLTAVERLVSPLPRPEHPEHHYVYDPQKSIVYVATTLTWLGDSAAEPVARELLAALQDRGQASPRPRRVALAQIDLGKALVNAGKYDEAAASAISAVQSGRLAPVDRPRVREIVAAATSHATPGAAQLADAYHAEFSKGCEVAE